MLLCDGWHIIGHSVRICPLRETGNDLLPGVDWVRAGKQVRRDRARVYGSRSAFADACGLSVSTLGELERGVRENFDDDTLGRIEDALGWAPGSVRALAAGRRVRAGDQHLARLHQAWPQLPLEARALLADLAQLSVERRRDLGD